MNIDWKLNEKTILKAKRIHELRVEGKKWDDIIAIYGNDRTYLLALHRWYLQKEGIYGKK